MTKILVIRFFSAAEILLTTPVIRCLKKQLADTEIHFLTDLNFKTFIEHNPYIDRFFYFDEKNNEDLLAEFKIEKYDHVIDLQKNAESEKIKSYLKVKCSTLNSLAVQKFLLTNLSINLMPKRHFTQRCLDIVEPLNIKDDGLGLDYFIPEKYIVPQNDIPASHHAGFIALVIGASAFTQNMPLHKWQELCTKLDHPVILLGDETDFDKGEEIAKIDWDKIYNSCGKFNLNESADLLRQSRLIVSQDSSLLYIACALKKQVLVIWGGTSPELETGPYYGNIIDDQQSSIYENISLQLRCQPCSTNGLASCPLEHFNCLQKQDIDLIVQKIYKRIGRI